jgi:hypothetical protein
MLSFKQWLIEEEERKPYPHIKEVNPGGSSVKSFLDRTKHGMARYAIRNNEKGEPEMHVADSAVHTHRDIAGHAGIENYHNNGYVAGYLHHDRDTNTYHAYHHPGYKAADKSEMDVYNKLKDNDFKVKNYGQRPKNVKLDIWPESGKRK